VLIAIGEVLRRAPAPDRWERLCLIVPHDLYLAWISVAVIANSFQVAHVVGFGGFGIPEQVWAIGMMVVATGLAVLMAARRGNWTFPFVVAWALHGIAARYAGEATLAGAARAGVVVGIGIGAAAIVRAVRGRDVTPA